MTPTDKAFQDRVKQLIQESKMLLQIGDLRGLQAAQQELIQLIDERTNYEPFRKL
jgi:hypothetical protein